MQPLAEIKKAILTVSQENSELRAKLKKSEEALEKAENALKSLQHKYDTLCEGIHDVAKSVVPYINSIRTIGDLEQDFKDGILYLCSRTDSSLKNFGFELVPTNTRLVIEKQ